ncbi:MAG TPA: DNA repair protein RadA [Candidatus Saccharimonadales bacterium]|jgi:DNA repair protein RadA/Sms|nr:DNA repair protein RadA [Candidatus Saccharimonadales bacterium]
MVKNSTKFICQQCGTSYSKWSGRCEQCGAWNSLLEQAPVSSGTTVVAKSRGKALEVTTITSLSKKDSTARLSTGIADIDTILGGGLVPGSVTLLAGEPGMGKSTVLLQVAHAVAQNQKVLYISGEESLSQIKGRAMRLKTEHESLELAASTSADDIAATIRDSKYALVIVDSIQTMAMNDIASAPGTVSQITNTANLLIQAAKSTHSALVVVGHVTKEGSIAGPKILEHLVDVVINFEGDRYGGFKIMRAIKNRFGATNEAALFEMTEAGLIPVANPSAALLDERQNTDGSVVFATIEGNRPLLVEIQALVNPTNFGYPKRTASGYDGNRLSLLIAVLERRTKLQLSDKDIYINVVGGLKLQDPAADLAVCMAIASAATQLQLASTVVVFGEVGLSGEIRSVTNVDKRIAEAKKLGFTSAIGPIQKQKQTFVTGIRDMRAALNTYLKKNS